MVVDGQVSPVECGFTLVKSRVLSYCYVVNAVP